VFTQFDELDALLVDLTGSVRDILGDTFVGSHVQGSFALGPADINSDCDFIVATTTLPSGPAERGYADCTTRSRHGPASGPGTWKVPHPLDPPPPRHHDRRPAITNLVDEVPPQAMRVALPDVMAELRTWAPFGTAWA
jgi:hypothetical protein